jgi:hypothetical protein
MGRRGRVVSSPGNTISSESLFGTNDVSSAIAVEFSSGQLHYCSFLTVMNRSTRGDKSSPDERPLVTNPLSLNHGSPVLVVRNRPHAEESGWHYAINCAQLRTHPSKQAS